MKSTLARDGGTVSHYRWTPYVVLLLSLIVTGAIWRFVSQATRIHDQDRFDLLTHQVERQVVKDSASIDTLLTAVAAYLDTEPRPTPKDFHQFISRMRADRSVRGIVAFAYAPRIPTSDLSQFSEIAKRSGVPNVSIKRIANGEPYQVPLLFSETVNQRIPNLLGMNLSLLPGRGKTFEEAIRTGTSSSSGVIRLIGDPPNSKTPGLVIADAVYEGGQVPSTEPARQKMAKGFVFLGFHPEELFVDSQLNLTEVGVRLEDVTPLGSSRIYGSAPLASARFQETRDLMVLGRTWRAKFWSTPIFDQTSVFSAPNMILFFGLAISALLFLWFKSLSKNQTFISKYIEEIGQRESLQRLLSDCSSALARSLDFEKGLAEVTKLIAPEYADAATIGLVQADGSIRRIAGFSNDNPGAKAKFESDLGVTESINDLDGVGKVIRTGVSLLYSEVDELVPDGETAEAERRRLARVPPCESTIIVPLKARSKTFGALKLVWTQEGRRYSDQDLELAEELARRIAVAIDNARLFREAKREIGERRVAEQKYRELSQQLELAVEERTRELSLTNRELESFAYSVAHDLRSPLRSMDGFSKALMEDYGKVLDAEGIQYLERIRASTLRMDELITALLTLSRLTRAEIHLEQMDMSELACAILAESNLPEKYEFAVTPNLRVMGDRKMLHSLLGNLLNNAIKFSGKMPHPRIEVGMEDGAFFVRDNGAGFNATYKSRLFQPFERLHSVREFTGSGIGLATAERIVRRHSGEIWAEGEEGKGATFYFRLPLLETEKPTSQV